MIVKYSAHLALAASLAAAPQEAPEMVTRQLWDASLIEHRPAAKPAPGTKNVTPVKGQTTPVKPSAPVKGTLVGVTVWSFRASKPADTREVRALVHEGDDDVELTPERVAADQPLAQGQKLRIGIEVSKAGYLYVIDRDEYADGSKGDPFLIFPARNIMGGNNKVLDDNLAPGAAPMQGGLIAAALREADFYAVQVGPGMLVEIPAASDRVPYFTMKRSKPNQTKEVLTILISPTPIPGLTVAGRQQLDEKQLADWEKQWRVKSYQLGDAKTQGQTYTVAEKQAASGAKPLSKDDPLPQLMYRLDTRTGEAGMMDLPLRIAK